ncbi:hypothetical protein [Hafnia alvei]|uniref:hypothetical protein n=1 Tax=Hafnia alvei TaxID=569 RepID=UPI00396C56FC
MTKLTTERLETIATWRETYGNGANVMIPAEEAELMARQLLAYEQAAKNPIGSFHISGGQVEATTDYCRDGEWPVQDGEVLVYAVPVLPKQPELIGMKVSIDTGSDNIGHRLFGEIVGTSDSNGVPVLCIEVAENNGDMAAPAQPVSEPYKLKDAVADIRNSGVEIDADKIKAERDSLNSPVIPDGWKLVPIEPTAAMFHAFNDCDYGRKSMRERYIQMIEAAPAQESE